MSSLNHAASEINTSRTKLTDVFTEESKALAARWQTDKLLIVPGDLLLDSVCRKFGVRFNKEMDGARLAALMEPYEIPSEIKALIKDIES